MNNTNKSLQVVQEFFNAINMGNMEKAAGYMAKNHHYTGPMFSTNNPEDYFKALGNFEMEFAVETQDLIGYENSVTHVSILKVLSPVQANIPCCEVFDIKNDQIIRQRFFFDTALFPKALK
jgi:limonene-1,2-epoxide hydrolase